MASNASIPLDKAYLTAICVELVFFGVNMLLFSSYLHITRSKRAEGRPIRPFLLLSAIVMFAISTAHVSLGFYRLIEAFIYKRNDPGGPSAFFGDVSQPHNVAKIAIHTVNDIISDSIITWRCYHVWGKKLWICALPVIMITGSFVCGIGQTVMFAEAKTADSVFTSKAVSWVYALVSISLATNVIVTLLTAVRIWTLSRQFSCYFAPGSFKYRRVLLLVVESGAIYSAALFIELVLYVVGSNAFYIVYDPICQLTTIVPTLILVMVSLGVTTNDYTTKVTSTMQQQPVKLSTFTSKGRSQASYPSTRPTLDDTTHDYHKFVKSELGTDSVSVENV